ncbi:MAG: flagellar basal-body rod protein FlgF [bacterium]|nr:flagellar basal-body rod protein FlgF [bacterium]
MIRGLYTGTMGMLAQWTDLDVVANNLANIDTSGYKKDATIFMPFDQILIHRLHDNYVITPKGPIDRRPEVGSLGTGVGISEIATLYSQGPIQKTDNEFDLAISGNGFFAIEGPQNKIFYTRNGTFTLDAQGYLVTQDGYKVMGSKGYIQITQKNFSVGENGLVLGAESADWKSPQEIDLLKIVDFKDKAGLQKVGNSLFEATKYAGEPEILTQPKILQGYLEKSNVNPIEEMVKMIEVQRIYEINQRAVTSFDDTLKTAVTEVGRVG